MQLYIARDAPTLECWYHSHCLQTALNKDYPYTQSHLHKFSHLSNPVNTLKMTFPTVPAYVQHPVGWPEATREHPAIDFMFDYEKALDWGNMKAGPHTPWHSDDYVYVKSGVAHPPGAPSWAKFVADHAPFTGVYHEPFFYVIHDTPTGWELIGEAKIFVNLPVPGAEKVKDAEG